MPPRRTVIILSIVILMVVGCTSGQANRPEPTAPVISSSSTSASSATHQETSQAAPPTSITIVKTPTVVSSVSVPELQIDRSKLSKELHLYNWDDYIDPSILNDFEKKYGVKVIVDKFDSLEGMMDALSKDDVKYDVVVPQDYNVEILKQKNRLLPLDKSLLPNIAYMNPANLDQYYDKGNQYSVPYFVGMTGIVFNKKVFPTPPDSWAALFDVNELKKYKGKVAMLDGETDVIGAALLYLGKSVNETDPATLKQVEKLLKDQQPYLKGYDSGNTNTVEWLVHGEIVIAQCVSGSAIEAFKAAKRDPSSNLDVGFVIPKEGAEIWEDNLVIPINAPNPYTAHVFINFLMRPDMAARNAEALKFVTPNLYAEKLLSPELQAFFGQGLAPNAELNKRLQWVKPTNSDAIHKIWVNVRGETETPVPNQEPTMVTTPVDTTVP